MSEPIYKALSYVQIFDEVQKYFSETFYELLNQNTSGDNIESERLLKRNIEEYIKRREFTCFEEKKFSTLVNKLFNSMCRYDFLTPYIFDDDFILENGIEEINCNAWNSVFVTDKTGTHRIDEHFPSPEHAVHIINVLAAKLNKTLNDSTPKFLGEIRKNIRIACTISPIATADATLDFSIRIVALANFTRQQLIESETLDDFGLSLLETCLYNGINVCVSGAPFSGKTATMAYLLSYLANETSKRILTIEIESREFNVGRFDEQGRPLNNVISWCTRESESSSYRISSDDLEELALRYNPQIIGVGEMRNKEALITCEIANTGITVISTTHAENAADTYHRIVMLCKKALVGYDDATLYRLVIMAFPIIAYQELMEDGQTHKITEIIEGVEYKDGKIIYRNLLDFNVTSSSTQLVTGYFKKGEGLSSKTINKLIKKSASPVLIQQFVEGGNLM